MHPATALTALLLLAPVAAEAQSLSVSYLDGEAQVRNGSTWSDLAMGDHVPVAASVRLGAGALVQLRGMGVDIALTRPGTYILQTIVAARTALTSGGAGSALASAMRYLFGPGKVQAGAAGARASNEGGAEADGWVQSAADDLLQAGKEDLSSGRLDTAIEQFKEALWSATEAEAPEIRFYLGSALLMKGEVGLAWKTIAGLNPNRSDEWAGDFVLLKAKLLEDTCEYEEALTLLKTEEQDFAQDARRSQLYFFLLGLGYRGAGDTGSANQALSKALSISKETEIGKSAAALLQSP